LPATEDSAISGGMGRVRAFGLQLAVIALAGCAGGASTPEEAHQRLVQAVAARDASRLFDALDLATRWSWMSIQRAERETYDILLSNFPEGPERERLVKRCQSGALSENARALFSSEFEPAAWEQLAAGLPPSGTPRLVSADRAELAAGGRTLDYRRAGRRGWGYAGLAAQAEDLKRRALADLEQVRASAADYERLATRRNNP
jgi:hypothetical protein